MHPVKVRDWAGLRTWLQDFSIKLDLHVQCCRYHQGESYGRGFGYKDVLIDKLVMDWLDPLLENLKHLIGCNDLKLLPLPKKQIKELEEKLISLRNFLEIAGKELETINNITQRQGLLHKTSEDLLTRVKILIEDAIYLSHMSVRMEGTTSHVDKLFFDLLVRINHIEPEIRMIFVQFLKASKTENPGTPGIDILALVSVDSLLGNLEELLKDQHDGSVIPLDAHQLALLHQELSFLRYFLMDPHLTQYTEPEPESFNSLLMQVEAMAREGASLTHSISDSQNKDDMAKKMILVHSNLLETVNLLKAKIRQMYLRVPKPSTSNFPRTPRLGFLDFSIQNLEELLKHRADSIGYVKNEIETVQTELGLLSSFIRGTIKNPVEDEHIARRVVDMAYEAEHVIDLISASNLPSWYYMLWLSDVIEKIKMLRKAFAEVYSKKTCNISVLNVEKAFIYNPPQAYIRVAEEEMVGFNDEAGKIIDRLTRGSKHLDIVSIVGMPGLGKTTLAKKVYKHPSITRCFHFRSWYCTSQAYERRKLLLSILGDLPGRGQEIWELNDLDLARVLYKTLKGRRYLIIIDNIWSTAVWDEIRNSLPDDCNGSRILFTSQMPNVALRASPISAPHPLRPFSDEESWELLQNKVFKQRSCPPELYEIGKQIAKKCEGLPLFVVLIAGVLRSLEESEDHWKPVLERVGKQSVGDLMESTVDLLELSYQHLPDHLKPCFLYLGAFPEGEEIPTWKLIRLWKAEGFVRETKSESVENVADGYLMDLIARNLVLIAQNKSNGGVKSCHVHYLIREFTLNKAKDENFLLISEEMGKPEQYRHCFYRMHYSLSGWMPYNPYVRSLFFFPTMEESFRLSYSIFYNIHPFDFSVLPYILKLLRVLDLERTTLSWAKFPTEIELLFHLRYLAVRGKMNHIPSSVGNLWRLETFIVKGTSGEVKLPETLFEMAYLKHVCVNDGAAFELLDTFQPEKSFKSDGIENLSTLFLRHGDGTTEKVIRRLRCLRKLKCRFLESWDYSRCCNLFPVLDLLSKLESLNVTYRGRVQHPCEFSFPSNLKKLTLTNFRLPWSEISKIARLPQLEVLKLLFKAFEGRRWAVSDDEFCNLKVLKLESLDIVEWDASPVAFPCLEQLVLQRCMQLEEIPSNFGELATLRMIEVKWCNYCAIKAVCKIQEEQEDLGADGLKVLIQPPYWESAAAS